MEFTARNVLVVVRHVTVSDCLECLPLSRVDCDQHYIKNMLFFVVNER